MEEFSKLCPKCGDKQVYSCKKHLKKSIKLNRQCRKCMFQSKEYRDKHVENSKNMWKENRDDIVQKRNTKEAKEKWRRTALETFNTKEYKELQNKIQLEYLKNNPEKNEDNRKKIKSLWNDKNSVYHSEKFREKLSETVKIALHKPNIRRKHLESIGLRFRKQGIMCDVGQMELLEKWNKLGFDFKPNYQIVDKLGLFYIDGYDKKRNVILEYDSKYHLKEKQKQKDLIRQNKIINILKPKKFWRYDSVNKQFKNVLERNG